MNPYQLRRKALREQCQKNERQRVVEIKRNFNSSSFELSHEPSCDSLCCDVDSLRLNHALKCVQKNELVPQNFDEFSNISSLSTTLGKSNFKDLKNNLVRREYASLFMNEAQMTFSGLLKAFCPNSRLHDEGVVQILPRKNTLIRVMMLTRKGKTFLKDTNGDSVLIQENKSFTSALPSEDIKGFGSSFNSILECFYDSDERRIYVVDLLQWQGESVEGFTAIRRAWILNELNKARKFELQSHGKNGVDLGLMITVVEPLKPTENLLHNIQSKKSDIIIRFLQSNSVYSRREHSSSIKANKLNTGLFIIADT